FLLQVTTGCSANSCTFCGAYMGKPFTVKDYDEIAADIEEAAALSPDTRRAFLMDGDALAVNNAKLLPVLKKLQAAFPKLSRISSYANGYNITQRSSDELAKLYENKMSLIYMGLESGNQDVLDLCRKRSSADEMIEAVRKADSAGIKSSVIILLGLGGKEHSEKHVQDTIKALNKMQPRYLSFLSVMLIPGTPLYEECKEKRFEELDPHELLVGAHSIIKGLELEKTIFRSNHASNYLSLEGRFPKDKNKLLNSLDLAINGKINIRSEFSRGL
ncbi:MAG: radical SAM protein, partial [Candidatus Omnitrophica bacterium]|nr:radical SAM protein [Candidatus Omnitrophota bacterium]